MGRAAGSHHGLPRNARRTLTAGMMLLAACLAGSASAAKYGGGTGTAEYPFLIYTVEDFLLIGNSPDDWDKQFKQMRDIGLSDCNETKLHPIGRWTTLGALDNRPFFGTFDGNGKTISDLKYKDANQEYVGLFQFVSGTIANVKLVRATVIGNRSGTGSLVGYLEHGIVKQCSATEVYVSGNQCVGGLIGRANGGASRCCSYGRVSGIQYVGGLAGELDNGTLVQCYSKAAVVGNHSVGGLVGATLDNNASVDSCYATGSVDGTQYVGGLAGQVVQGNLYRCYSTGEVAGTLDVGGVTGSTRVLGEAIGCLWDKETSKQATSPGSVGKTTPEMKSMDTYLAANWNFLTIWTICEGLNYPVLLWQIPRGDLVCPDGVTWIDFVWFAKNWRHTGCMEADLFCEGADLDSSGAVGYPDLAILAQNWLAGIN